MTTTPTRLPYAAALLIVLVGLATVPAVDRVGFVIGVGTLAAGILAVAATEALEERRR